MDKEIIELLKSLAGNAEALIVWYMVLDFVKTVIGWGSAIAMMYAFGFGVRGAWKAMNE
jgi:hypothetical protein